MILRMHQFTSVGAGYQHSLEGWAKAGINHVEPVAPSLDGLLKTDTLANAKRILTDNGLTIVYSPCVTAARQVATIKPPRLSLASIRTPTSA